MIAEDYNFIDEPGGPVTGTTQVRHNRNLSNIISTIQDDGPSVTEAIQSQHEDGRDAAPGQQETETGSPVVPATDRSRALPGLAVLTRVTSTLLIFLMLVVTLLLAIGRYPQIDQRGLQLVELPDSVYTELTTVKANIQDTFSQWAEQAGQYFAGFSESSVYAATNIATIEAQQQHIMDRLDALTAAVADMQLRNESEQSARLAGGVKYRVEQQMQMQVLQGQLAGLQQQFADSKTPVVQAVVPQPDNNVTPQPAMGDWVVNVASSAQQASIKQLQEQLAKQDVFTELQRYTGKSGPRFRLRVTGFSTGGEAKRYAARLAQEAGLRDAWASKR